MARDKDWPPLTGHSSPKIFVSFLPFNSILMDTILNITYKTLEVRASDGALHISLARSAVLNAVNFEMVLELHAVLDGIEKAQQTKAERRAHEFRAAVLAFRGGCVGIDVAAADADADWQYQGIHSQQLLAGLVEKLYRLPLVVVCVADGPVVGLGLGLWLASDLRVATARSTFRCGFSSLGISNCDMGVSWLLPKVVGSSAAARMMLLNGVLSAEEALRHDLTHVVEGDLAAATARAAGMVSRLGSQHSAPGLALTKRQMKEGVAGTSLGGAIVAENAIQTYLLSREDVMRRARGVLAGLSKL